MQITEKTNFMMSVVTIITLIVTILGVVWYLSGRLTTNEMKTERNCLRLDKVEQVDVDRNIVLIKLQTHLAQIETDLKWIINDMGGK